MTSQRTELALAAYRPRPGRENDFLVFLHEELALLRRRGHVTERRAPVVRAPEGELLVVLEWSTDHAVDDAHADPEVLEVWDRKAELVEYIAPAALTGSDTPFARWPVVLDL
jgi:uncharacterized protein (DUF1684 family)